MSTSLASPCVFDSSVLHIIHIIRHTSLTEQHWYGPNTRRSSTVYDRNRHAHGCRHRERATCAQGRRVLPSRRARNGRRRSAPATSTPAPYLSNTSTVAMCAANVADRSGVHCSLPIWLTSAPACGMHKFNHQLCVHYSPWPALQQHVHGRSLPPSTAPYRRRCRRRPDDCTLSSPLMW